MNDGELTRQLNEFRKSPIIWRTRLQKIEAHPLTPAQAARPDTAGWFSAEIDKSVENINSWIEENVLDLTNAQTNTALQIAESLLALKVRFGLLGLGKPKKCRKCGLDKV